MKRLLRISLDTLISSFMSILIWFVLSITVDKSLINIFTLTFPIQFVSSILVSIFATGANISKQKENENDTMSGIFWGIVFAIFLLIVFLFNIDSYLNFMKYSVDKTFVIYSVVQIFLHTIFNFILTKLYYEGKNKLANKYSIIFYILNFIFIFVTSIIFTNRFYIVISTLIVLAIYTIYILIKNSEKFKLNFNILKWIKCDAVTLNDNFFLGLAYLFGLSSTVSYGENYALALTFVALITDTQWDISNSISTVAKIDISQNNLNYKEHVKNAKILSFFLILSAILMLIIMFGFYNLDLSITLIFLIFHIIDFAVCPYYKINTYFLQLKYSTKKTTAINLTARFLRLLLSFLKTPFCTVIAQVGSSVYQAICMKILFSKNYEVDLKGEIVRKNKK